MSTLYILDEETAQIIDTGESEPIITGADWQQVDVSDAEFNSIVILCELNWEGKNLQDFYGFEIATELRRKHKLLCPIILTSTLKQPFFERQAGGNIDFNILFGRGTGFLEINDLENKLDSCLAELHEYPLTEGALIDMNEMLLSQRFVIDKVNHDLKPECDPDYIVQRMDELGRYLDKYQKSEINWECRKNELKNTLAYEKYSEQEKEDNFKALKKELVTECERVISDINAPTKFDQEKRHKIIVLEDDKRYRQLIEKKLGDKFQQVFITDDATKAVEELKKDGGDKYVGIITDWRLYKNNKGQSTEYWQSLQGYEVLKRAAQDRFIALFSLTSESEKNVHKIRNELGLRIHLLKKQHLRGEGWDILADTIQQKCDEIKDLIGSQPTGARWTLDFYTKYDPKRQVPFASLKSKYIKKRNSNSWNSFEYRISEKANDLWDHYNKVFDNQTFDVSTLPSIKENFGYELAKNEPNLVDTLVVRRIYLALFLSSNRIYETYFKLIWISREKKQLETKREENPKVKAYCVLNGTSWETYLTDFEEKKGKKKGGVEMTKKEQASESIEKKSKTLANNLCIKTEILPREGILPEEKRWLKSKGIDINNSSVYKYNADKQNYDSEMDSKDLNREPTDDEIQDASDDFLP